MVQQGEHQSSMLPTWVQLLASHMVPQNPARSTLNAESEISPEFLRCDPKLTSTSFKYLAWEFSIVNNIFFLGCETLISFHHLLLPFIV